MVLVENPDKFANKFKLKSSRLQNWNYASLGIYFITICTYNHNNFFGKIIDNKMELSKMGLIVNSELLKTFEIRKNLKLHKSVLMPNHIHILMEIIKQNNQHECRDVARYVSTKTSYVSTNKNKYFSDISPKSDSISTIIRSFKSAVTKQINLKIIFFAWQPSFHDEIIKDKKQYLVIKQYIQDNVINWQKDKFYKD